MRIGLVTPALIALLASPTIARCAERPQPALAAIKYVVADQNRAVAVPPAVYAAYVGSCLNADAKTVILGDGKRTATYVCVLRPKVLSEMETLRFLPRTVGFR